MTQATPPRTRRRSPEEWAQLMIAYEESGLSQQRFCQKHGLGYSTFGKWKKRLSNPTHFPEADWIEMTPTEPVSPSHWDVELTLGAGMVLRIRRR